MLVGNLNTNFLLKNNYKISKISKELNDLEIVNEIDSLIDDKLDNVIEFYINEIIISAINFDGQKFHDTYNEGIEKFGLINFYRDVILVTMKKIGLLWYAKTRFHLLKNIFYLNKSNKKSLYLSMTHITKINLVKLGCYFYLRMNFMK